MSKASKTPAHRFYGPRQASVAVELDSGCTAILSMDNASSSVEWYRNNRPGKFAIKLLEHCTAPGCGGSGTRARRIRNSYRHDPCAGCTGTVETLLETVVVPDPPPASRP